MLAALLPVIILLALGVLTVIAARLLSISPIVGYLLLGLLLGASGLVRSNETIAMLAELGVVFLLFDVGLHFSLQHLRAQAKDIFGFGPVQLIIGTLGLGLIGLAAGLPPLAAFFTGATLSLSSTAVVARIIAERHQQSCPVGLTATAILVFQDLAAIFLLIAATAFGTGAALGPAMAAAFATSIAAFAISVLSARFLVRPVFHLVAKLRNEEVFTAMALLIALAAAWATGRLGLSLTLGAFLGGMMLSDTPYKVIIQSEIKPFRGLLLGFFFISVGLSLQVEMLLQQWAAVLGVALGLVSAKVVLNALASLAFRWSVPGSTQIGFLLAQGSEFAFIIFSLPPVRAMVGDATSDILLAAVVLSLAVTPNLADLGRLLAGRLRTRSTARMQAELEAQELSGPALIVGMGPRGRTIADALSEFDIRYAAIESDPDRLRKAIADGYRVMYGDLADPRIWEPAAMQDRQLSILTAPSFERSSSISPIARQYYPGLTRMALVDSPAEAPQFATIGLVPIVESLDAPGLNAAQAVLDHLGIDADAITAWADRQRDLHGLTPSAQPIAAA